MRQHDQCYKDQALRDERMADHDVSIWVYDPVSGCFGTEAPVMTPNGADFSFLDPVGMSQAAQSQIDAVMAATVLPRGNARDVHKHSRSV